MALLKIALMSSSFYVGMKTAESYHQFKPVLPKDAKFRLKCGVLTHFDKPNSPQSDIKVFLSANQIKRPLHIARIQPLWLDKFETNTLPKPLPEDQIELSYIFERSGDKPVYRFGKRDLDDILLYVKGDKKDIIKFIQKEGFGVQVDYFPLITIPFIQMNIVLPFSGKTEILSFSSLVSKL